MGIGCDWVCVCSDVVDDENRLSLLNGTQKADKKGKDENRNRTDGADYHRYMNRFVQCQIRQRLLLTPCAWIARSSFEFERRNESEVAGRQSSL